MKARLKFKYPHKSGQIIRSNFKVAGKRYVEDLASSIQGGNDFCYTWLDPQTLEAKTNSKWKRINKQVAKQQRKNSPATNAGPVE
jgi:hypothetical protein